MHIALTELRRNYYESKNDETATNPKTTITTTKLLRIQKLRKLRRNCYESKDDASKNDEIPRKPVLRPKPPKPVYEINVGLGSERGRLTETEKKRSKQRKPKKQRKRGAERKEGREAGRMNGSTGEWMNERMGGRIDGWKDGRRASIRMR